MPVSTAPKVEACNAIVARINAGSGLTYTLPTAAAYAERFSEDLRDQVALQVDVVHLSQTDLNETLDVENRTSHQLRIWVRKKLPAGFAQSDVQALDLIVRQIFQRINEYRTSRVAVWDCGVADEESPDHAQMKTHGLFSASIALRVEVEPSP